MSKLFSNIKIWIRHNYYKIVNSIAFYPAFISLTFLIFSIIAIRFDFSETGKSLKSNIEWLNLQDADTARNIVGVIAAGIISLTVFSFSMVMIVLNQAASKMSNRVLNKLIGNRFQQVVLGVYIGTIMFALFLNTTIRDIKSGIYIPAISTYLLIILAIIDIFIFIYFIHFITQSVKYEIIIQRILNDTKKSMERKCTVKSFPQSIDNITFQNKIAAPVAGVYEDIDIKSLLKLCKENEITVKVTYEPGVYVLKNTPILEVNKEIPEELSKKIQKTLIINQDETIESNYLYGFRQLSEVAIKALSPGINDPGTARLALRAIFYLLDCRIGSFPENIIRDDDNLPRIYSMIPDFENIAKTTIAPIWDYGKNDRIIQNELSQLISQFLVLHKSKWLNQLFREVEEATDTKSN